jgi:acetoin:2,6-dichlorophenolindophenol oxidoreductase subunit beta
MPTVAKTIENLTRNTLEDGALLFGQCITAVGWIQNTVPPDAPGLVELPMNDVSGPGIAIGAAISGTRSILVLRFQSFLWYAAPTLLNYAAKSMDIWEQSCPLLVRAIAMDRGGPVHTGCFHTIFNHMPGFNVYAPMTPGEVEEVWHKWQQSDQPYLLSEHRNSYTSDDPLPCEFDTDADITLMAISASRFNVKEAANILAQYGVKCDIIHIYELSPLSITEDMRDSLEKTGKGLVIDCEFNTASTARDIAHRLMLRTSARVEVLGMHHYSTGVADWRCNETPTATDIAGRAKWMLDL